MAARIRRVEHSKEVRERIKTTQLLIRLGKHALGEVEMSQTQIRAAEILLRKTVPDLSSVEHSGQISIAEEFTAALRGLNGTAGFTAGDRPAGDEVAPESGDVRH